MQQTMLQKRANLGSITLSTATKSEKSAAVPDIYLQDIENPTDIYNAVSQLVTPDVS